MAITNQEIIMSSPTVTEKKPKKPAKKKAEAQEKAPAAIGAKSALKPSTVKSEDKASSTKSSRKPSHEEISWLAHRFFEQRGSQHGWHEQDWLRAELELTANF
jgi:Protein of unknown function (DUF2934)